MQNNLENSERMLQSADSIKESADSVGQNRPHVNFEHLNFKAKQREQQRGNHKKIENQEKKNADIELKNDIQKLDSQIITQNKLNEFIEYNYSGNKEVLEIAQKYLDKQSDFGRSISESELKNKIESEINEANELSYEDQIKSLKEQLSQQGKSPTEILKILISKFEKEEAVSTWISNWRNFLKLHLYAKNKPPTEQRAIQRIISNANFTAENSFDTALSKIQSSTEISNVTKSDLQRQFGAANIKTVSNLDSALNQIKNHKKETEQKIDDKKSETESLKDEISSIEKQLDTLTLNNPKREQLENELQQKQELLKNSLDEIKTLEADKPEYISFMLRNSLKAQQNPDGSRSVQIVENGFVINLPNNRLFVGKKNLRSVNLAFPFQVLQNLEMEGRIFVPNILSHSTPSKDQRNMGHLILKSLGYDDTRILSELEISQLSKDLSLLKNKDSNSTGKEDLIELGIWNVSNQEVDISRLENCLKFIRNNRDRKIEFHEIKN